MVPEDNSPNRMGMTLAKKSAAADWEPLAPKFTDPANRSRKGVKRGVDRPFLAPKAGIGKRALPFWDFPGCTGEGKGQGARHHPVRQNSLIKAAQQLCLSRDIGTCRVK